MCNGTHQKSDFYMKLELKHCKTPPTIHLVLKWANKIDLDTEMKDGHKYKISSKKNALGIAIPVELSLTLKKNRNRITTGVSLVGFFLYKELILLSLLSYCSYFVMLPPNSKPLGIKTFVLKMSMCMAQNNSQHMQVRVTFHLHFWPCSHYRHLKGQKLLSTCEKVFPFKIWEVNLFYQNLILPVKYH